MNLSELKLQMLEDSAQIIVFRRDNGVVVDSCHSLSDVGSWIGRSLYEFEPLMRSMNAVWTTMGEERVELPCVDYVLQQRQGYYDFSFQLHPNQPDLIIWLIRDQTRIYRYYQGIQQQRNEMLLNQRDKSA